LDGKYLLQSSTTFQTLGNLGGVLVVGASNFLDEVSVGFVDKADIFILVVGSTTRVVSSSLLPINIPHTQQQQQQQQQQQHQVVSATTARNKLGKTKSS
jgi:hypothetical protein